jgi:hypothetical protein
MGDEKDEKKVKLKNILNLALPEALAQMKNQLAEELKVKGADEIKVDLHVHIGDKINIQPQVQLQAPENVEGYLDLLERYSQLLAPVKRKVEFAGDLTENDIKWVTDHLETAVNSSAVILSTAADLNMTGIVTHRKAGDGEGTDTGKAIDLTGNGPTIKDITPEPKTKKDDDVDEGEGI